jgi:hypothetical protein
VGICSTMESKYRYRNVADYDVTDMAIPKDAKEKKAEYRKQGYGMKKVGNEWAWVQYKDADKTENPDIADVYNTVLKMAKKRAQVDATLTCTAASDIFTQDIEDMQPEPVAQAPAAPRPAPAPRQQPEPEPAEYNDINDVFPADEFTPEPAAVPAEYNGNASTVGQLLGVPVGGKLAEVFGYVTEVRSKPTKNGGVCTFYAITNEGKDATITVFHEAVNVIADGSRPMIFSDIKVGEFRDRPTYTAQKAELIPF